MCDQLAALAARARGEPSCQCLAGYRPYEDETIAAGVNAHVGDVRADLGAVNRSARSSAGCCDDQRVDGRATRTAPSWG